MKTVVDTNILIAFWDQDEPANFAIQTALDQYSRFGGLVIPAPVYGELRAGQGRTEEFLDQFLADTSPLAYEQMVDRYLASKHFGE